MVLLIDGNRKTMPNYMRYVVGGLAGMMATCIVQPLDLIKTRMQIDAGRGAQREYTSSFNCLQKVIRSEGVLAIYSGIGAGLLRQATYTTGRMGAYQTQRTMYLNKYEKPPPVVVSMCMGIIAGALGAFVGNPAELVLIRMMADNKAPPDQRRNYKNVGDALIRVTKEEGIFGLWRGCMPTITRAMVVNAAQLTSYSQFKQLFNRYVEEGWHLHFCASMMSGLLTTIASMPLDMAKTRIQNQKGAEYKGTLDVFSKVVKHEGFFALWKGFTPYFCRLAPHTVFSFIFLEQLSNAYYKFVLHQEGGSSL